jgi:hypothetical protein
MVLSLAENISPKEQVKQIVILKDPDPIFLIPENLSVNGGLVFSFIANDAK